MRWGAATVACAAVVCAASSAHAFWEFDGDTVYADARAFVAASVVFAHNPDEPLLYPHEDDGSSAVEARLLTDLSVAPWLRLEANLAYGGTSTTAAGPRLVDLRTTDRSPALMWRWGHDPRSQHTLEVDWLGLRTTLGADSSHPVDLRVGRLPINLATTFYFTPNDFFSPFAADTFFRSYKPGVDGVRVDGRPDAVEPPGCGRVRRHGGSRLGSDVGAGAIEQLGCRSRAGSGRRSRSGPDRTRRELSGGGAWVARRPR